MRTTTTTLTRLKRFIKSSALLSLMIFALLDFESCSSDDSMCEEPAEDIETAVTDRTLSFHFSVDDGTSTRSGRELWSSDPKQQVNDMRLLAFKQQEDGSAVYCAQMQVDEFSNTSPNDTQTEKVALSMNLEEGSYTFLAVGFESDTETTITKRPSEEDDSKFITETLVSLLPNKTYSLPELKEGETTLEDVVLSLNEGVRADEVFAGQTANVKIAKDSRLVEVGEIRLYRVVAGVLGYFKNIPYYVTDKENDNELKRVMRVALVASAKGEVAKLKAPFDPEEQTNGETELLSFSLSSLKRDGDSNIYAIPAYDWSAEGFKAVPAGVTKVKNSVLGGRFLLPFGRTESETLRVVLYDEKDEELRSYAVVCNNQKEGIDSENKKIFDILGNHYYCLGLKHSDTDEPENPQPDEPIDLSKEQVITIKVNPHWDLRHDMTL